MIDRFADPRFVISLSVMVIFAWAFAENVSDDTMKGAIIGALNIAVGYWLGSSSGSARNADRADKAMEVAHAATVASASDPTGKQGDPVHVVEEGK